MACGLKNDSGTSLLDTSESPWSSLKASNIKPPAAAYKEEIVRRFHLFVKTSEAAREPKPKAWKKEKAEEWLNNHPINDPNDVAFLKAEIFKQRSLVQAAHDAKQAETDALEKQWRGKYPFLRLIHCIVDNDDAKRAFLQRNNLPSDRLSIENRNSTANRERDVWDTCIFKFFCNISLRLVI